MPILAAYMVPHPPMIVPQVGKGSEKQITKTVRAYEAVAEEIAALKPETIIISSPHSVLYADYFHLSPGKSAAGDFGRFGAPQVSFRETYDTELGKGSAASRRRRISPRERWANGTGILTTERWCRCSLSNRNTGIFS